MHENITYNPLQQETIKYVNEDSNLVVLAPTSSGKTIVAEQFILPMLEKGKKAIYLSPLKALTQEKLDEWSKWPHRLVAFTSDHLTTVKGVTEPLILMTTEALDSKSRGTASFLSEVGVIVCDEAHLLSVPRRGDAFEIGLTRFASINKEARIIALSATMPNAQEIGDWLTTLNGKPTRVVQTDWRPVVQEHRYIRCDDSTPWGFAKEAQAELSRILREERDRQILIFVHSIYQGETISKTYHIPFHYSKIPKSERNSLEEAFRTKKITRMVSTSTLAWGVNLPADVGIIYGGHRGPTIVDAQDIKQMAGRIGRYGLSENGLVYYIFGRSYASDLEKQLEEIPPINSQIEDRLYFHINSFIARERRDLLGIFEFLKNSFYHQQLKSDIKLKEIIRDAIYRLLQVEALYVDEEGSNRSTALGMAAAFMYVDPVDLYYIRESLKVRPMTPTLIAKALVSIPSLEVHANVPKDLQNPLAFEYGTQTVLATYLRDWLEGKDIGGSGQVIIGPYVKDFERMASALRMAKVDKDYIDSLLLMIKYGVPHNMLDLVTIEGIGRKRASDLVRNGITTKEALLREERLCRNILGTGTYNKIVAKLKNPNLITVPD